MILKSCLIEQEEFILKPSYKYIKNTDKLIDSIKSLITKNNCSNLLLDLSGFNMIYAAQIGILASTHHFIKYIDGKITIIVDDENIKNYLLKLNFMKAEIIVNQPKSIDRQELS